MTANIQKLFTSYQPLGNTGSEETGATYVGQQGRLWYDPVTNTLRASDGNTAGGTIVTGGGSGGNPFGGNTQIQYSNNGIFGANANFTFDDAAQTLYFPNASVAGNIVPTLGNTFNLGSPSLKWANIYVGPNSIFIQDTANAALNAEIQVTNGVLYINGVGAIATNTIINGNSAIYIQPNANILFSAGGGPNVLVVTANGSNFSGYANVAGNLDVSGNFNVVGNTIHQGDITVDGNVDFTGANVSIGSVSNLSIGGGSNLQFLQTAGNGNLRWANAVYNVTAGVGLSGGGNGNVGIDATGVTTVAGTANQVFVNANTSGGNSNATVTLTLPQNIGTGSSPTFANLTITGNLTVSNIISTGNSIVDSKILNLAANSTANTQIDQGGIILGNVSSAYKVSILYTLANNEWDTDGAGVRTLNLVAANANIDFLNVQNGGHFGLVNEQLDYPNAYVQIDANVNSYSQIVSQNHSPGTAASADLVLVNDIGDDGNYYLDLGINGSNYVDANFSSTTGNDGYLFMNKGNLVIGTDTADKAIKFVAAGTTGDNVHMTITDTDTTVKGNVIVTDGNDNTIITLGTGGNIFWGGGSTYINLNSGFEVQGIGAGDANANIVTYNTSTHKLEYGVQLKDYSGNLKANNFTANTLSGNGAGLNHITGANVTGAVAFATTANAVAGANVSGAVTYAGTANSVAGGNVVGAVANATYAATSGTAGTVTTAAQPNITSVGNLANLTSNGTVNFANAANVNIGAIANLHVAGGSSGYVLQTDGSGTLSWVAQAGEGAITTITPNALSSTVHVAAVTTGNTANIITDATTANTANTLVLRDANGAISVNGWTVGTHLTAVNYTATNSDYWIGTTTKSKTITLPNAANGASTGRQYQIADAVHNGNPGTIIDAQSPATVVGNQPSQQGQIIIATYIGTTWYLN